MTPEPKRKKNFVWTQEAHDLALKMWNDGKTSIAIAKKLKVTDRVVHHHISQYRHKFPWRRSARRPHADHTRVITEICTKEHALIADAAKRQGVAIAAVVRNALMLAKEQGYPVTDHEAMLGELTTPPPALKARRPFRDKTKPKKLIPYAGAG